MNAVDKGAQHLSYAIEHMNLVREHCSAVQNCLSDEKHLLEITLRIAESCL